MANKILNPSIIARACVMILDNELGMASRVYRDYESEFNKSVNGYKVGSTVNIRRPAQFQVRNGATAATQDVTEGQTAITVGTQKGVDFKFTSSDLTLNIGDLAERVIKPAMVPLANAIDQDVHAVAMRNFWNLVGTPGNVISTYPKFLAGKQRLDEMSVPPDMRSAALSPADHTALLGNQSGLYIDGANADAYRKAKLGGLAGIEPFMTQNAPVLTTGTRAATGTVAGAGQAVTYTGAQANTWGQTLSVAGLGAAGTVSPGEVFTIAGVFAVNPVTKQVLPYLQQFVAPLGGVADGSGAIAAMAIQPAIIVSGAYQTVSAAPGAGAVITWSGAASTSFQQNLMFHKNSLALCVVPMEKPAGAVSCSRVSRKGISVRLIPYYDGTNDASSWRLDVLYGVAAIDPRLGARVNG